MGVKDLWVYLSPTCEKKSLWEMQGQTIAIDLSCWICDSQKQCLPVLRPYLRNLFFRTSCLLMLGIRPVFVLEGEVPIIKQREIKRRMNAAGRGGANDRKIKRSRLNGVMVQCQKLLDALGVGSLRSPGEAESMCAHLNAAMIVDGCISQDSDCFLYGARVVYRNFSAACSGAGFTVDSYDMGRIQDLLGLNREGLVALALLCGCDYQENSDDGQRGVTGVGIESASQLIFGLSKICDSVISRLKSWRTDPYYSKLEEEAVSVNSGPTCIQCGHRGNLGRHDRVGCKDCDLKEGCKVKCCLSRDNSLLNMQIEERKLLMLELRVRAKAVAYSGFPPQSIIDEFLAPAPHPIQLKKNDITWDSPQLASCLEIAETHLGWSREYSLDKLLPLLTRWKVMQGNNAAEKLCPYDVKPVSIKKKRVSKGVQCFEVEWTLVPSLMETNDFCTLEPCPLFEKAYPSLVLEFVNKQLKDNRKQRCGADKKAKAQNKSSKVCSCLGSTKKGHICQFLNSKCDIKNAVRDPNSVKVLTDITSVTKLMKNVSIQDLNSWSTAGATIANSDDDFDPLELSDIINCIVEGNCSSSSNNFVTEDNKELAKVSEHQHNKPKISTEFPEDSLKKLPSDEINNVGKTLYSRLKHSLKKENESGKIESLGEDMKMLCKLENVNLEKIIDKVELTKDNSYFLEDDISPVKGQLLEPNFDLGISALLQSPEARIISKSTIDTSP